MVGITNEGVPAADDIATNELIGVVDIMVIDEAICVVAIIKLLELMVVEIIEVKVVEITEVFEIADKLVLMLLMLEVSISADSKPDIVEVDTARI